MSIFTHTQFMEHRLGAKMRSFRNSWGAKADDGSLVFTVWAHHIKVVDGKRYAPILWNDPADFSRPGYSERLEHLEMFKSGAKVKGLVIIAKDPSAKDLEVKDYVDEYVVEMLPVFSHNEQGDLLVELGNRIKI